MADQLDSRPVFIMVMGCNGAGKSAWKRGNYDRLPDRYFDQDSIAGGIGDWNSEEARERTKKIFEAEIAEALKRRLSFGIESTFSGRPGPEMVERVRQAGYRVEGIYLGTESPAINVARIEKRVLENTGHRVDPGRVPERYKWSLSNLRRRVTQFDQLEVLDNSRDDVLGIPDPVELCYLEKGKVMSRVDGKDMPVWCADWLVSVEQSLAEKQRLAEKRRRGQEMQERQRGCGGNALER